jgi:hypothetical protein
MDGSESSCGTASGVIGADGFFLRIGFALLERIEAKGWLIKAQQDQFWYGDTQHLRSESYDGV